VVAGGNVYDKYGTSNPIERRLVGGFLGNLTELVERTGVDELMIVTSTHDGVDRLRSYELLADVLAPVGAPA
jgi:hypothetical protein